VKDDDFSVVWSASAERAASRLPEKVVSAVIEFVYGRIASNPYRLGKPLKLDLEGLHSARRGAYRVIYRIDDRRRAIELIAINHRADVNRGGRRSARRGRQR
jgi:mRNA interferase RelE/StbE